MLKLKKITALILMMVMLLTPALAEAGAISDSWNAGWDTGYDAGQHMIQTASALVCGTISAVGAAVAGAAGIVVGAISSLGKWFKKGIQKVKALAKKAYKWVKGVAQKMKAKFKKFWAGVKKFWKMIAAAYQTGYDSVAGGSNPAPARAKQIKKSTIGEDMTNLIVKHQEARFKYVSDKKYQPQFNSSAKMQKTILSKVSNSIVKGDYYEYDAFMKTLKKLAKTNKGKNADNLMAFGPVLEGLHSKIKSQIMRTEGSQQKDLTEMLEEVNYYTGFSRSYSDKFYTKGAVKMPVLK